MKHSYWGKVQTQTKVMVGVYHVTTASHGGLMIADKRAANLLSPAAYKRGILWKCYRCYEEDCLWAIVANERPEWFELFGMPRRELVNIVLATLKHYYPDYLAEKQAESDAARNRFVEGYEKSRRQWQADHFQVIHVK